MQLSVERAALLKALGHVQSVVERRNTIPILSNVLLSANDGALALSATDLDMEIVDEAEARVATPGQITAPAHTLYEIVRKLPEGAEVELRLRRRRSAAAGHGRPLALQSAGAAGGRLSGHVVGRAGRPFRHRHQGPDPADRQDALRHLHRGDPLLPVRPLPALGRRGRADQAARGGDRRAPAGAGRNAGARKALPALPASSSRARRWPRSVGCWRTPARASRCRFPPRRYASTSAARR